ncbi:MAG: hypothetical protein ACM3NH_04650 [Candidatus Saccharibacteria bacterium]
MALSALIVPGFAAAQSDPAVTAARSLFLTEKADPTGKSVFSPSSLVVVEAGTKESSAKVQAAFQLGEWLITTGLSAPVEKGATQTLLADSSGLRSKTKGQFGLRKIFSGDKDPAKNLMIICKEANIEECSTLNLKQNGKYDSVVKILVDELKSVWVWSLGLRAEIAPENFKYSELPLLAETSRTKTSKSVGLDIGIMKGNVSAFGTYERVAAYKAGDKNDICTQVASSSLLSCKEKVTGAPKLEDSNIVGGEIRYFISSVAFNPRLSYDLTKKTTAAELPAYFIRNDKGQLTGGVSVAWQSEDKWSVSVFVSQPLGLISK